MFSTCLACFDRVCVEQGRRVVCHWHWCGGWARDCGECVCDSVCVGHAECGEHAVGVDGLLFRESSLVGALFEFPGIGTGVGCGADADAGEGAIAHIGGDERGEARAFGVFWAHACADEAVMSLAPPPLGDCPSLFWRTPPWGRFWFVSLLRVVVFVGAALIGVVVVVVVVVVVLGVGIGVDHFRVVDAIVHHFGVLLWKIRHSVLLVVVSIVGIVGVDTDTPHCLFLCHMAINLTTMLYRGVIIAVVLLVVFLVFHFVVSTSGSRARGAGNQTLDSDPELARETLEQLTSQGCTVDDQGNVQCPAAVAGLGSSFTLDAAVAMVQQAMSAPPAAMPQQQPLAQFNQPPMPMQPQQPQPQPQQGGAPGPSVDPAGNGTSSLSAAFAGFRPNPNIPDSAYAANPTGAIPSGAYSMQQQPQQQQQMMPAQWGGAYPPQTQAQQQFPIAPIDVSSAKRQRAMQGGAVDQWGYPQQQPQQSQWGFGAPPPQQQQWGWGQ